MSDSGKSICVLLTLMGPFNYLWFIFMAKLLGRKRVKRKGPMRVNEYSVYICFSKLNFKKTNTKLIYTRHITLTKYFECIQSILDNIFSVCVCACALASTLISFIAQSFYQDSPLFYFSLLCTYSDAVHDLIMIFDHIPVL